MMQGEVAVRECKREDLDGILKIERENFSHPWSLSDFLSEISTGALSLVAEIGGKVVGYIFCRIVVDTMDVNNLSVDRGFRRRGIAKMLLQECLDIALKRGVKTVFLEVRKSNAAAINLYKSFGFGLIAERKGYYRDGEDALVFALKL